MNKQELKQLLKDSEVKGLEIFGNEVYGIPSSTVLGLIDQLDKPSFICLKDVIKRIKELDVDSRILWIDKILEALGNECGFMKYSAGFKQGKFDGMMEREKVKIPQFVADIIEEYKEKNAPIIDIFTEKYSNKQYNNWLIRSLNAYDRAARAWLDGYEVEEEKRYRVRFKGLDKDLEYLNFKYGHVWVVSDNIENEEYRTHHTRKELEDAGFGWVFDCEGIDVEEVQDD